MDSVPTQARAGRKREQRAFEPLKRHGRQRLGGRGPVELVVRRASRPLSAPCRTFRVCRLLGRKGCLRLRRVQDCCLELLAGQPFELVELSGQHFLPWTRLVRNPADCRPGQQVLPLQPISSPVGDPVLESLRGCRGCIEVRAVGSFSRNLEEGLRPGGVLQSSRGQASSPGDELRRLRLHPRVIAVEAVIVEKQLPGGGFHQVHGAVVPNHPEPCGSVPPGPGYRGRAGEVGSSWVSDVFPAELYTHVPLGSPGRRAGVGRRRPLKLLEDPSSVRGELCKLFVHAHVQRLQVIRGLRRLLHRAVLKDGGNAGRSLDVPYHYLPRDPPKDKSGRGVRVETGITDFVGGLHTVRDARFNHKVVIDALVTRRCRWCVYNAANFLQPSGGGQFLGGAVPVPPQDPWPN